ncbi:MULTISPECIES: HD domain-containing protein [Carnobacterium]|uniref:HD domain-containing protein n=1 Tax=Carnobacterium divergens TaxID=2748 RepID=A0A2R7ZY34_CARDV|nr:MULTISPECIES: HD domain-containing protein [Carnobacterium]ANZ99264.1 hydrolase [Carnobacterium divergens]MCO6018541.1 HD domain-containing protein [Carnobacterium divergens]MDT1939811.1 HD domain-containing protein [Carnobacterium divergens]MDT1942249.1 HD domain-containing protein [Carnobacterium divergens]MDT1948055.1 HD domain-containing protein [Carnobacterium divergens]
MGMHQYIKSLSDLENIIRCPGKFKYEDHSVASHSFKVTQIAQFLGTVEEQAGQEINWRSLYEKALNHDYTELFIGDIKTPVKYATPALREMLADVEDSMMENFVKKEIPEEFQAVYLERLKEGKDSSLEGQILSVADKVDLLYESFGEIQKGNPESVFTEIYEESLKTILEFDHLASVNYFLEEVLPDLLSGNFTNQEQLQKISKRILNKTKL